SPTPRRAAPVARGRRERPPGAAAPRLLDGARGRARRDLAPHPSRGRARRARRHPRLARERAPQPGAARRSRAHRPRRRARPQAAGRQAPDPPSRPHARRVHEPLGLVDRPEDARKESEHRDMTDQRVIEVVADWVDLEGPTLMGRLTATPARGKEVFAFEYDGAWLSTPWRQQLDPSLTLYRGPQYPAKGRESFGVFLDSAPDRWGRMLMQRREA